jgi:hypothetical protein
MSETLRKHAITVVVTGLGVLLVAAGIGGAHNNYQAGHVLFAHKAGTAKKVKGFTPLALKKVSTSVSRSDTETARQDATKITLFHKSPFTIYAKCFKETSQPDNHGVWAEIYIKTSSPGAVFSADRSSSNNAFLDPSTPEDNRTLLQTDSYAGTVDPGTVNISDASHSNFWAAGQSTQLTGNLWSGTKVGSPIAGNGLFGAGDRCIFGGTINSH